MSRPPLLSLLAAVVGLACTGTGAEESSTSTPGEGADPIERIEGDHGSVCAFAAERPPLCWGALPPGLVIGDDEPAAASDLGPLASSFEHVEHVGVLCGLEQGAVICWGKDYGTGLLGDGLGTSELELEEAAERGGVEIGASIVALDSGAQSDGVEARICALTDVGELFCWGSSATLGYPGVFVVGEDSTPAQIGPIDLGGKATAVDVGGLGACAVLSDGTARCWGSAALTGGEPIGDDEVPADGPLLELGGPIRSISVGDAHVCAIVDDGQVKCWGGGSRGELGQPGVTFAQPSATLEPVELGSAAVEVVARIESSCARLDTGEVLCWGKGQYGQTGHPWSPGCELSSDPLFGFDCGADSSCCIGDDETPGDAGPVELPAPARDLVGTSNGPCALLEDDTVVCWGGAQLGLIGDGQTPSCYDEGGWLCAADPRCCVGDDETPVEAARPVSLKLEPEGS